MREAFSSCVGESIVKRYVPIRCNQCKAEGSDPCPCEYLGILEYREVEMYVNTQDLRNLAQQHRDRGNALIAEAIEAVADVLDHMAQEQNANQVPINNTTGGSTESGENSSAQ